MGYLSDIARRRIAAVILTVSAVLAIAAIADLGPFGDPPSEEERVTETVERLFAAAGAAEFDSYCDLLTDAARTTVEENAARLLGNENQLACPEVLAAVPEAFAGLQARIREVSVSGPRARVEANVRTDSTSGAEARTVMLEQGADGAWRVSDPS